MKNKQISFIACRMEFEASQTLFGAEKPSETAKRIIIEYFNKKGLIEIISSEKKKYFLEVEINDGKAILFKIGKDKRINVPMREPEHISNKKVDACPFIWGYISIDKQILAMQCGGSIYSNPKEVIKNFIVHFEKLLEKEEIIIKYQYLKTEGTFWKAINESEKIFKMEISLNAPNFLGETFKSAKELTDEVKNKTNMTEMSLVFKNEDGNLKLPSGDLLIEDIAQVIDKGGGNLKMTVIKKTKKRKSNINLASSFKRFNQVIDKTYQELSKSEVIEFLKELFKNE